MKEYQVILNQYYERMREVMTDENYNHFLEGNAAEIDYKKYYNNLKEKYGEKAHIVENRWNTEVLLARIVKNHVETEDKLSSKYNIMFRELCGALGYYNLGEDLV